MLDKVQHLEVHFCDKDQSDTRVAIVLAISDGASIRGAARKYGVGPKYARRWYRAYIAVGIEQVIRTWKHYAGDFKLQAIEYRRQNRLSYAQASVDLGMPGDSTLLAWEKIYLTRGVEGLQDKRKGRPPKLPNPQIPKKSKKPPTHKEELEVENARLRMENDYLKK